jgi:hypothetical protein
MSLLPQLERELRAAHERRAARPWRRRVFRTERIAVLASMTVALSVAIVAVVALGHRATSRHAVSAGRTTEVTTLLRGLDSPSVYPTPAGLFVSDRVSATRSRLVRIDPASGHVTCDITFGGVVDDLQVAGGTVWVTSTSGNRHSLWRLEANSLVMLSPVVGLGSSPATAGPTGSLAVASRWLWVGRAGSIERVSLETGAVTARVPVARANGVELAADADGRVLLDTVGAGDSAWVQRRDPHTGALVSQVPAPIGSTKPHIDGIIARGVWFSQAGGMAGAVSRRDLVTMARTSRRLGTNAITAHVAAGRVVVSQPFGGPQRNYCADPGSGRPLVALSLPIGAEVLAVDAHSVYYIPDSSDVVHAALARAPLDRRCR